MKKIIKEFWNNKTKEIKYEMKYEKALLEIEDLKNQIKYLNRKLDTDYKNNLIKELKKQLENKNRIIKNLREDNIKLIHHKINAKTRR